MTVSNTTSVVQYNGNGSTVNWPTVFRFFKNTDLVVTKRSATGVTTILHLDTDYSVTGANSKFGGTVITVAPLLGGPTPEVLTIARILSVQQLTDLRNQGKYFAETHEDVFDYLTMLIQQNVESDSRSLKRPVDSDSYQAEGRRISNLGYPVASTDAANLQSVKDAVAVEATMRQAADAVLQDQITGAAGLVASQFSPLSWHDQVIATSVTIPPNKNAWSFGPVMTIAVGQAVTIGAGSFWTIANGATTGTGPLTSEIPNPLDLNT